MDGNGIHFEGGIVEDVVKHEHQEFAAGVELLEEADEFFGELQAFAMVVENMRQNRLEFTTDIDVGVSHGTIIFIAVGTHNQLYR